MCFGARTPPPVKDDDNEEIKQTQADKILEEEQTKIKRYMPGLFTLGSGVAPPA